MKCLRLAPLIALFITLAWPVQARHSFAMFDKEKLVTVKGVASKVEWRNPHVFFFVDVPDGKGGTTQYAVECNTPNVLMHTGWKPSTLKVGESIGVALYRCEMVGPAGCSMQ